jgi:hypothetical protein
VLDQAPATNEAADRAAQADLIVFCAAPDGDFPLHIKGWVETWLRHRGDREGMLIGLMGPSEEALGGEGHKHHYLRNVAHRGAMDYLTHIPQDMARISDSLDSYTIRADEVTSVLDDILHQQMPPPTLLV